MEYFKKIRSSLATKLVVAVGLTLLLTITVWAYFTMRYQQEKLMNNVFDASDRIANTIKLGAQYAMMRNAREDISQIVMDIAGQQDLIAIRIYNKEGKIKFSNETDEIDQITPIDAPVCNACHHTDPPKSDLDPYERMRILDSPDEGRRLLEVISPIPNQTGCASTGCHVQAEEKTILGALDVVASLEKTDLAIEKMRKNIIGLACLVFFFISIMIYLFVLKFVNRPIRKLIGATKKLAKGESYSAVDIQQDDEMGRLAQAIETMARKISDNQAKLNKQRDEYQNLFERVPCLITVHDKDYRLIRYNREFAKMFNPEPGMYCYTAYKGRDKKCQNCPVEKTFQDGKPHYSEETGLNKDGTKTHWITRTSPIRNSKGEIIAAVEMNLDITPSKELEEKLKQSESKYHAIFNNIPNPVFVLDFNTLSILDCNHMVTTVYGYAREEMLNETFLRLFQDSDSAKLSSRIKTTAVINKAIHQKKDGTLLYVDIWVSPSESPWGKVLLVTTSDITQRLETEQQLIQASKLATLGEMATGVAHELNQPLSVIKTVSSFFIKKMKKHERIKDDTLSTMLIKVDDNVDRASKIINHMRQFARKSEMDLERVQVNEIMERTFDIFSQQLKVRGIQLVWDAQEDLPKIMADPGRLEQVFINLLVNARDAIEKKWDNTGHKNDDDQIIIKTRVERRHVVLEIRDTGVGIPETLSEKIFDPFFTTKEVGKGTGLGLSISYGIIKECNGSINVLSESGNGACFIIKFPIPN